MPLIAALAALASALLAAWTALVVIAAAALGAAAAWALDRRSRRRLDEALAQRSAEVEREAHRVASIRRDFVTNASHELKTPVAAMQALAESLDLAVDGDPVRARRMINRLEAEAQRLSQLVRDLLDLARLEEQAAQRARRVDLAEVVESQVEALARLAGERRVAVNAACERGVWLVAVPEDLRLLVSNLLENAILYNVEGGSVRLAAHRNGSEVLLEVADTGIGIPERDQDRVFERFYRVDRGRSRALGGTGLGLAIVRHAVARQGGQIRLQSTPEEGSVFTVTLPVEGRAAG